MSEPLLIGADVGTTKTKAAAFTLEGRVVASAARAYPSHTPAPGHDEQDPDDHWSAFEHAVASLAGEADLRHVVGVGVCGQANTDVFVDADGRPLRPAITWRDQRCAAPAAELDARAGPGLSVTSSSLVARAAWIAHEEPEVWDRTASILTPKDYVNLRLTGAVATDPLSAFGHVSADGRAYAAVDRLAAGLAARLPPLADPVQPLGGTRPVAGLPADVPVAVATMDAWGSVFGSGALAAGDAFEVSGTSEILGLLGGAGSGAAGVVAFPPYRGLRCFAGPTQAGGEALRWYAGAHGLGLGAALAAAAEEPAGAGGVVFLPHLAGERAPLWDAALRACFVGLTHEHDAGHECRAVLEGVACSARHVLEVLEEAAGVRPDRLALSGGAAASDLWSQIKADVLGRPLVRLRVLDSGVLGAALMAGVAAGVVGDLEAAARQMVHAERTFEPDPDAADRYDEVYGFYREAQAALAPLFAQRARRSSGLPSHSR